MNVKELLEGITEGEWKIINDHGYIALISKHETTTIPLGIDLNLKDSEFIIAALQIARDYLALQDAVKEIAVKELRNAADDMSIYEADMCGKGTNKEHYRMKADELLALLK